MDLAGAVSFDDSDLLNATRFGYRLVAPGSSSPQPLQEVWVAADTVAAVPGPVVPGAAGELLRLERNPAHDRLRFVVHLERAAEIRFGLYEISGRRVDSGNFGWRPAGDQSLDAGSLGARRGGLYLLRVNAGPLEAVRRVVVLH